MVKWMAVCWDTLRAAMAENQSGRVGMDQKIKCGVMIGLLAMALASKLVAQDSPAKADDTCLLYTSPSPRDLSTSRMPSSA